MSGLRLDAALATLAVALGVLGTQRARRVTDQGIVPIPVVGRAPSLPMRDHADTLGEARDMIAANDPFRVSNAPSEIPFDPRPAGAVRGPATPPPASRPVLVLKAIVGGPPWQAVIDGLPGQPNGTLVGVGSTFDKVVVRSVTRDTVVVKGADTTWALTLGRGRP